MGKVSGYNMTTYMQRTVLHFFFLLTKAWVDESVPHAPVSPHQPPAADTGREAERGAEQTHEHVTHTDVEQKHVHGSSQGLEFTKQNEDD